MMKQAPVADLDQAQVEGRSSDSGAPIPIVSGLIKPPLRSESVTKRGLFPWPLVFLQFQPGDDQPLYLARAFIDFRDFRVSEIAFDG